LYASVGDDPVNAVDPSGFGYFFLNDRGAVSGQGHAASLVGNPTSEYDYYYIQKMGIRLAGI
jgi:hypothetical protein